MKIVYVFETVQRGGAEFLVINMCKSLLEQNENLSIKLLVFRQVDNDLCNEFEKCGVKVHSLELPERNGLITRLKTIKNGLDIIKPDVVHCHSGVIERDIMFVSWLLRIPGRFVTIHNVWLGRGWKSRVNYFIVSLTSKKIIAVSNAALNFYLKHKLYFKKKLKIIYNGHGLDTSNVKQREKIKDISNVQLINVGALREAKGQIYLIKAMKILQEENVPVHLTIYGDDRYDGYGERLYKEAEGLKNVTFFGGTSDVKSAYGKADIYVTASVSEAMPITLLEALGMGIPIVASDIDPHKEILGMIDDSIVVKKCDPGALAEGIKSLINNDARYKEYSQSCLKLSRNFHIRNTAKNHFELYNQNNIIRY